MTDAQFTILIGAITAAGGAVITTLRWAVGRLTRSIDASTQAMIDSKVAAAAQTEVLRAHTEVLREVRDTTQHVAEWCDAHTGVAEVPAGIRPKARAATARTPARGTPIATGYGPLKPSRDEP